jgi:hypothetical protein
MIGSTCSITALLAAFPRLAAFAVASEFEADISPLPELLILPNVSLFPSHRLKALVIFPTSVATTNFRLFHSITVARMSEISTFRGNLKHALAGSFDPAARRK